MEPSPSQMPHSSRAPLRQHSPAASRTCSRNPGIREEVVRDIKGGKGLGFRVMV